ncbi:unnamed protein product [Scytosiphon promiscuus]
MVAVSGVFAATAAIALAAGGAFPGVAAASSRLDVIDLPVGFGAEGIALAEEWTVFVSSVNEVGSIWKGDLRTGEGEVVLADAGGIALGLDYDRRSGYLFVCGSFAGTARVYDTKGGAFSLVAEIALGPGDGTSLINDVIISKTAAYFTDSILPQLYSVPLEKDSGELASTTGTTIPLSPEFTFINGTVNSNGIEITDDEETLIVVNMAAGELFTVDPATGNATLVDLGGVSLHGDGMVLRKNTLWVVQHPLFGGDVMQISEVALSGELSCGTVVRNLTSTYYDFPATAARKGNSLYYVNGKFGVPEEDVPSTPYEIVRVDRDGGEDTCGS